MSLVRFRRVALVDSTAVAGRSRVGRDRGRRVRSTEGWWTPGTSEADRINGKVEWDEFSTGAREISFYVRRLPVEDNTAVEVIRDGDVLLSCVVRNGKARHRVDSQNGGYVPELNVGDTVLLRAGGRVIARTTMELD
jgi:hypothetical protein